MRSVVAWSFVVVSAMTAALSAQDAPQASRSIGEERWRVVAQPSPPVDVEPPARLVPPLSFEPLVLISESASAQRPVESSPPVYRGLPPSAPVYAQPPQPVPPPVTAYKPLVPITPPPKQYYLGRGLFGQPKLYVPDQPVRNFLRYFSF